MIEHSLKSKKGLSGNKKYWFLIRQNFRLEEQREEKRIMSIETTNMLDLQAHYYDL